MRITLLLFAILLVFQIKAQKTENTQSKIASSEKMLEKIKRTKPDSIYIDSLISLGKQFLDLDLNYAKLIVLKAISLTDSIYDHLEERNIESKHLLAIVLLNEKDYKGALKVNQETLDLRRKKYPEGHLQILRSKMNMSICFLNLGEKSAYEDKMWEVIAGLRSSEDYDQKIFKTAFYNFFNYLKFSSRYNESFELISAFAGIQNKRGDFYGLAETLVRMANFYLDFGKNIMAIDVLQQSQQALKRSNVVDLELEKWQLERMKVAYIGVKELSQAKKVCEQLESISKDDLVYLSSSRGTLALIYRLEGDNHKSEKYIKKIFEDFAKKGQQNSVEYAELLYTLSVEFGNNNFDVEALNFSTKAYNIFKSLKDRGGNRFYTIAIAYGTGLQNTARYAESIAVFEEIKRTWNDQYLERKNYLLLCSNLAGSYANIKDFNNAVNIRNEFFEHYFKGHISEFYDNLADKNRINQIRDLNSLGRHEEIIFCLRRFNSFHEKNKDFKRQADCFIELSNQYRNNYFDPVVSEKYIDSAEQFLDYLNDHPDLLGKLYFSKADLFRRQGKFIDQQKMFLSRAYNIFKEHELYSLPEFKFCVYRLAKMELLQNNNSAAVNLVSEFSNSICQRLGGKHSNCISSKIKEIEIIADIISEDSLSKVFNLFESNYYDLIQPYNHLLIEYNNLKGLLFESGSFEQRQLLSKNIRLSEESQNIQQQIEFKSQLAENLFISDSIEDGLQVWEEIFDLISEMKDSYVQFYYRLYAAQLLWHNVDIPLSISVFETKTDIIDNKQFEFYNEPIEAYLETGDLSKAFRLILEKENYLMNSEEPSPELVKIFDYKIRYFTIIGDRKNLLNTIEDRFEMVEKMYPDDPRKIFGPLAALVEQYVDLGNSARALALLSQKIEKYGWVIDSKKDNIPAGNSILDFILLHLLRINTSVNKEVVNMQKNNLDSLMYDLNEIRIIAEEWNPSGHSNSQLKELMLRLIEMDIIFLKQLLQIEIDFTVNNLKELIKIFNDQKKSSPELAELIKHQISYLLDYFQEDELLFEFNTTNNIPFNLSYYERQRFYFEADSIRFSQAKRDLNNLNKSKYLLSENEQLELKKLVTWSLNYTLLDLVMKYQYTNYVHTKYLVPTAKKIRRSTIRSSEIYELILNSSGSIIESKKNLNISIRSREDLKTLNDRWLSFQKALNSADLSSENRSKLNDSILKIERKLFQEIDLPETQWKIYKQIRESIDKDEILIHSFRIHGTDSTNYLKGDSIIYLHFIIDNEFNEPIIYSQNMNSYEERELLNNYKFYMYEKGKKQLDLRSCESLFGFLFEHGVLNNKKRIIHIPDGIYHEINLATIYNVESDKYFIQDYKIDIFQHPGSLKKAQNNGYNNEKTAVLIGSPKFDSKIETYHLSDTDPPHEMIETKFFDNISRGGIHISPLPGTKSEVYNVRSKMEKANWQIVTYTDDSANEQTLKKVKSPNILHIATHGYFLEDIPFESPNDMYLGMNRNQLIEDPMLRSGLLLAGAKTALNENIWNENNGIFSAFEASTLDLRNTELVVLSACETGKGEIKNSEGVYGLRKAFADAGAKNVIMSLWKVDDKVTQEFMTRFYEVWLNEKTTIREAFNRTQLEIMAKYPEPYYWGAFILVEN